MNVRSGRSGEGSLSCRAVNPLLSTGAHSIQRRALSSTLIADKSPEDIAKTGHFQRQLAEARELAKEVTRALGS